MAFLVPIALAAGLTAAAKLILDRTFQKESQKIKIVLQHAGNQHIPEFYEDDQFENRKSISFKISDKATIADVKDKISTLVKHADRSISLFTTPFGKYQEDGIKIQDLFQNRNTEDTLNLFIVIPYY